LAWIPGEDLGARIAGQGRLSLEETLAVHAPVADALDAAHANGLVHRDVKPGNVLLGSRDDVYLTDFGLARPSDALAAPTLPGSRLMGTAPFIAPEQLRPATIVPELAHRIDIYALACVAFACLTGDGPFRRDSDEAVIFAHADEAPPNITDARPDLPTALDVALRRALAKNPAERHATAREFVADLRAASAAPVVVPPQPEPRGPDNTGPLPERVPPPPPPSRRPARTPILAAAGGLALILVAVALATSGGAQPASPGPTIPGPTIVEPSDVANATPTPISETEPPRRPNR
jgi:serine/threonine-protein kinase